MGKTLSCSPRPCQWEIDTGARGTSRKGPEGIAPGRVGFLLGFLCLRVLGLLRRVCEVRLCSFKRHGRLEWVAVVFEALHAQFPPLEIHTYDAPQLRAA